MAKVDILNYISDSNILRSTYDTDTNELDITDVPQNLNSVLILGQGVVGNDMESYFNKTIEEIVLDNSVQTEIPQYMFKDYSTLKKVRIKGITKVGQYAFNNCSNLAEIFLPDVTESGSYSFGLQNSASPPEAVVVLPSITSIGTDGFRGGSSNFKAIDLGPVSSIGSRTFYQGTYKDVILRNSSVTALSNTNGVGIGGTGGFNSDTKVYVPSSLISSYENATNWSTAKTTLGFSFVAIEGSYYEDHYADGTLIGA